MSYYEKGMLKNPLIAFSEGFIPAGNENKKLIGKTYFHDGKIILVEKPEDPYVTSSELEEIIQGVDLSEYYDKDTVNELLNDKVGYDIMGEPNGVATLNHEGKIPESQLPELAQPDEDLTAIAELEGQGYLKRLGEADWVLDDSGAFETMINIPADGWDGNENTIVMEVGGVKTTSNIIVDVSGTQENIDNFYISEIEAISQDEGEITFKCKTIPTADVSVHLLITSATSFDTNILEQPLKDLVFPAEFTYARDVFFGDSWAGNSPKDFLSLVQFVAGVGYRFYHVSYTILFYCQDTGNDPIYLEFTDPENGDLIATFDLEMDAENRIDIEINDQGDKYALGGTPYYIKMSLNGGNTYTLNGYWESTTGFNYRVLEHNYIELYGNKDDVNMLDTRMTNLKIY